jgi:hypothetical protein
MNQFIYNIAPKKLFTNQLLYVEFFSVNHRAGANYDFPRHETTRLEKPTAHVSFSSFTISPEKQVAFWINHGVKRTANEHVRTCKGR